MTRCKACQAEIRWILTENKRKMPVDAKPVTVITSLGKTIRAFTPHFISCPKAEQFKRKSA